MVSKLVVSTAALLLIGAGCSNSAPSVPTGTGGAATGGSGTGSGGTASGGMTGSGGSVGSGGSTGTGGSSASGGSPGAGGSAATGGSTGSGGVATTGSGGSSVGGTTGTGGASSGGSVGSGGTNSGSGGANTGGGSGSGTGGAAGSGDLSSIASSWDGQLVEFPCGPATSNDGYDCANVGCTNGSVTHTTMYQMKGDSNTVYNVTFNVRGVVEVYAYVGGTRAAGNAGIESSSTLFASGGSLEPSGNGNDYNTYELDVSPPVQGEANLYHLNAVIAMDNPHTSSVTVHRTFPINYNATIKVMGGGTITFKSYDSNCRLVQNCGPTQGNMCMAPRTVDLSGTTPAPPASFKQPFQMPTGFYGQWVYFSNFSVTTAQ